MIDKKTKQEVLKRDNFRCVLCKTIAPLESVPHHCLFRSSNKRSDLDEAWNLVTLCIACHAEIHALGNKEKRDLCAFIALNRAPSEPPKKHKKHKSRWDGWGPV